MAKTEPVHRSNWAVTRPHMSVAAVKDYGYRIGHIITRHGVVGVYDQISAGRQSAYTRLDFAAAGRHRSISWERTFSDRYLKTLASRFAAECLTETPSSGGEG